MGFTIPKNEVNDGGEFELPHEGWHRCEVTKCEARTSSKGDKMYNLTLCEPGTSSVLAWDVCMLEGPGNGIGFRKLQLFGCVEDLGDSYDVCVPRNVEGVRAWCYLRHEEYNGKTNAKVDIGHGEAGYQVWDWPGPAGSGVGGGRQDIGPLDDDSDVPF